MSLNDITFLTDEQVFSKKKLDIIGKRGVKAAITDFSILLGGIVNNSHIDGDESLGGRTGFYWTKTRKDNDAVYVANSNGYRYFYYIFIRSYGSRLVLPFSSVDKIPLNEGEKVSNRCSDGILEVECGYYPQMAVDRNMQVFLEQAYKDKKLKKSQNKYTTDSRIHNDYNAKFSERELDEFEYEGGRYVRVEANSCFNGKAFKLSNGIEYKDGDFVWIEVSPIKWLVDEKDKVMVSKKLLFAGIQFNNTPNYTGSFEDVDIKNFIDNYFSKEIDYRKKSKISDEQEELNILEQEIRTLKNQKELLEKEIAKLNNLQDKNNKKNNNDVFSKK